MLKEEQKGRPKKLSKEQEEIIKELLEEDEPEKHGYRVWDGPSMSDYIKKNMDVDYAVRSCQKLFHRLKYNKIVPQTYPSLEDPDDEARDMYKKELRKAYADPSLILVFQDEVHFQVETSVTRKWARIGSKPRVMSKPGHSKASYSGYLILNTGKLWIGEPEWFNYQTTIDTMRDFLQENPLPDGKRYAIIMDNAPWHKKAKRLILDPENTEYNDIREKIVFIKLPPYSPDLNPIEQVWRITRREVTHNRYFPNITTLKENLESYFDLFKGPNGKFRQLCTFNWMKGGGECAEAVCSS